MSRPEMRARCRFVRRGQAFQAAQGFFRLSAGNGMAPFAAMSVRDTLPRRSQVCGERGVASCDVGQLFKPPEVSSDQAPATSWRPSLQQACKTRCRVVHRCVASAVSLRATWASFSSRPRFLQPKRRQGHGARCRCERARHAAASSTGIWRALCRFMRRGPAFQAVQELFCPRAGNGMVPLAAVNVQDTLPRRPQAFGERGVASCDVG